MDQSIIQIIKTNKKSLKKAYKDGHDMACYNRYMAGYNRMFFLLMSLIPSKYRRRKTLKECMLFNSDVAMLARRMLNIRN